MKKPAPGSLHSVGNEKALIRVFIRTIKGIELDDPALVDMMKKGNELGITLT